MKIENSAREGGGCGAPGQCVSPSGERHRADRKRRHRQNFNGFIDLTGVPRGPNAPRQHSIIGIITALRKAT